jgi:hypothetical protein
MSNRVVGLFVYDKSENSEKGAVGFKIPVMHFREGTEEYHGNYQSVYPMYC